MAWAARVRRHAAVTADGSSSRFISVRNSHPDHFRALREKVGADHLPRPSGHRESDHPFGGGTRPAAGSQLARPADEIDGGGER